MKKVIAALGAFCIILGACGGQENSADTDKVNEVSNNLNTTKSEGEILIAQSDCIGCHHQENKVIGPSYKDIAAKYENNKENIELLAKHIIEGSKGTWGTIPMTPHPKTTSEEAIKMVEYIMTLKN